MKILLAPDKFKDAISAKAACEAMQEGIAMADSNVEGIALPLADGGEGTAEVLTENSQGEWHTVQTFDPLGRNTEVSIGLSPDHKTAYIEMAKASGLQLLSKNERNCFYTSSSGTGVMIKKAVEWGVENIMLGIGGSATCDGGAGMASSLGYQFRDKNGSLVEPTGDNLKKVDTIETGNVKQGLNQVNIAVACDVDNFLTGAQGAAYVYGPQKGAREDQLSSLENGLKNLANRIKEHLELDVENLPGAGAAGGLGAGSKAFLGATLRTGIDLVLEQVNFRQYLNSVDWVITGEGTFDDQSTHGKVIQGVIREADGFNIPVAALCGSLQASPQTINNLGLAYATSILRQPCSIQHAIDRTYDDLAYASFHLARFIGP